MPKMTLDEAGKILEKHSKEKGPTVKTGFAKLKAEVVDAYLRYDKAKRKKKFEELQASKKPKKWSGEGLGRTAKLLKKVDD